MSFKNRAATALAAGTASFALIAGIAPIAMAQDTNNATSTRASNNGSIVVPTDSALNLRVVMADGKPTVMISNGYTGGSNGGNNSGSNEPKPTTTKATATETTTATVTKTAAAAPTTTAASTSKGSPSTTKGSQSTTSNAAASSGTPSVSESDLESRSDIEWVVDWIDHKNEGESFGDYVERVKNDAAKNKPTEKGNDSSGIAILDTETGEVRFKLSDLLKELGISPKGVDGTESSAESKNKANLDELSKLIDEGSVSFNKLPSFVKLSGKNGATIDTNGVKPGTYVISGTAIDANGNKSPFKFEIEVEDSGTPESTKPTSSKVKPSETATSETKPSETKPSETKPSETAKSTETKPSETELKSSGGKFYENAEIRPGSSLTIKPKSDVDNLDDYVFMNAMVGDDWIDVKDDGTITINMSDGASEGTRDIYVAYVKKSDEAKALEGDTSVVSLDRFKLTVSKDAKMSTEAAGTSTTTTTPTSTKTTGTPTKTADARAKQGEDPVSSMKESLNNATNKLRERAESNKGTGLYDDVEVAIGDTATVSPNDKEDRAFGAVLLTTGDGRPVVAAESFSTEETSGELGMNDEGKITISPDKIIKPGKYTASVITSKPGKADEFKKHAKDDNFDGFMTTGEIHEFSVTVTGEVSDDSDTDGASSAASGGGSQSGAGANNAPAQPAPQPAAQPAAQYAPQSAGTLAQTGVSLYAQLGLATSLLALAGVAAFAFRRRGFAS